MEEKEKATHADEADSTADGKATHADEADSTTDGNETHSIEESFARLDEMVKKLESRETSLEDSFQIYQEGMSLLKDCNSRIDRVEKKMLALTREGELHEF